VIRLTPEAFSALAKMGQERAQSENVKCDIIIEESEPRSIEPIPRRSREHIANLLQEGVSEAQRLRTRIEELECENQRLKQRKKLRLEIHIDPGLSYLRPLRVKVIEDENTVVLMIPTRAWLPGRE
jgi:hypothetical protein